MAVARSFMALSASAAALTLAGCAGGSSLPQLSLPKASPIETASEEASVTTIDQPVGSATDLYARIASGAMSCWFDANGPLKKDYIFHATADAPSRGGKARIVIHRRDPTQPNPRGMKTYLVNIDPTGESSATVKTHNLKMPAPLATTMTADVGRWSKGLQGCAGSSTATGWSAATPETEHDSKSADKGQKSHRKKSHATMTTRR
jgi:hypothetical protein